MGRPETRSLQEMGLEQLRQRTADVLREAARLPKSKQRVFRAKAETVHQWVLKAAGHLRAPAVVVRIQQELPSVDLARVGALVDLSTALLAAARIASESRPTDLRAQTEQVGVLRRQLLAQIEAAVSFGIIGRETVPAIPRGKGSREVARGARIAVGAVRACLEKLVGRTPITPEFLDEADRRAEQLALAVVRRDEQQRGGRRTIDAVQVRDQLWSVLYLRYQELWRIGAWLWGYDVDRYVVPLGKALKKRRRTKPKVSDKPAPVA